MPLHFCYFFPQTPSAESATEYGKLRGNAGMAGTGIFHLRQLRENLREAKNFCWWAREREKISHEDTKARRFFGRVAKATQTCRNRNEKKNLRAPTRVRSLKKTKRVFDFLIEKTDFLNFVLAFFFSILEFL